MARLSRLRFWTLFFALSKPAVFMLLKYPVLRFVKVVCGSIDLRAGFNVLFVFHAWGCFALTSIYSSKGWKKLADIHGIDSLNAVQGYFHDWFQQRFHWKRDAHWHTEIWKSPACGNFGFIKIQCRCFLALLITELWSDLFFVSGVVCQVRDR